jgi:hypothetical protein
MTAIKKTNLIIRIDPELKMAIEEKARERNLTVTEYLTRAGLGRATRQRADVDAINELRACVDELKSIHHVLKLIANGDQLIPSAALEHQMAAITAAIQRVWNNGGNEE